MFEILILLFFLPTILVLIDFVKYLVNGKRLFKPILTKILEVTTIIGLSGFYLITSDFGMENDCCSESATFSPEHRVTIYIWITICSIAFFYSVSRNQIAAPLMEVILNSILLIGVSLNIFIGFHVEQPLWAIGNFPIILLFLIALMQNQKLLLEQIENNNFNVEHHPSKVAWKLLTLTSYYKFPILILLCLPIIAILTAILILFGQKPDSLIKAFTDTYKHGLSELDYLCENIECGGHYLCSVAANGHEKVVAPKRLGVRRGRLIICNRQLLISNAFEELLEEKIPEFHSFLRNNYNKVGNMIHKHYHVFENKLLSDIIYVLMKPLELFFLATLYLLDRSPENRIAQQYLKPFHRAVIKKRLQQ